jgi:hypothetical protein
MARALPRRRDGDRINRALRRGVLALVGVVAMVGHGEVLGQKSGEEPTEEQVRQPVDVVDCRLPGQIRPLGGGDTYVTRGRVVRTTSRDCTQRGGEIVSRPSNQPDVDSERLPVRRNEEREGVVPNTSWQLGK